MKILFKIFILSLLLISCNKKIDAKIKGQQIVYDSIASYSKDYNIQILTTLEFNSNKINRKQYNDFQMIINKKDTFQLIPKVSFHEKELSKNHVIEYITYTKLYSKKMDNDSIMNLIKESEIINSNSDRLAKVKNFNIENVETFTIPKELYESIKKEYNIK